MSSSPPRNRSGRLVDTDTKDVADPIHKAQVKALQDDIDRRQASYIHREREYRSRIEVLEQELKSAHGKETSADTIASSHISRLRNMQESILTNVEHVQEQTARILQEQERDLLRAFRARLFDVQTELEKERANAQDGAAVWIEKNRQLEKELEWAKEMADRLDRHNQALTQENARLKTQFKTQEDDREYLIRQLVAAKKDNARLRQELESTGDEIDTLRNELRHVQSSQQRLVAARMSSTNSHSNINGQNMNGPNSYGISTQLSVGQDGTQENTFSNTIISSPVPHGSQDDSAVDTIHSDIHALGIAEESRFNEIIDRLRRMLDTERRNVRNVRAMHAKEVHSRTELEQFLRTCVDDVRLEIRRRKEQALTKSKRKQSNKISNEYSDDEEEDVNASSSSLNRRDLDTLREDIPLESFTAADRERVLLKLLSHESFLSDLHARIFPSTATKPSNTTTKNTVNSNKQIHNSQSIRKGGTLSTSPDRSVTNTYQSEQELSTNTRGQGQTYDTKTTSQSTQNDSSSVRNRGNGRVLANAAASSLTRN